MKDPRRCTHEPSRAYKWPDSDVYGATCSNCGTDYTIPKEDYLTFMKQTSEALEITTVGRGWAFGIINKGARKK